jgi:FkbM family methyltransferase
MQIPFSLVVPTAYGQMIINRNDTRQADPLVKTGLSRNHDEIELLRKVLGVIGSNLVVLDVGANFGTYALGLVPAVGEGGQVHAFEPQRLIFNMLAGSVALNGLTNVYCHFAAIGASEGRIEVPQFDYASPLSFGSIEFGPEQREPLTQERRHDQDRIEYVPLKTIDGYEFPHVDFIKIDVEGMETDVLRGARGTIGRCRPVMYVEFLKSDKRALSEHIASLDYKLYEIAENVLCIPSELTIDIRIDMRIPER